MTTQIYTKALLLLAWCCCVFTPAAIADRREIITVEESDVYVEIVGVTNALKELSERVDGLSERIEQSAAENEKHIKAAVEEVLAEVEQTPELNTSSPSEIKADAWPEPQSTQKIEKKSGSIVPIILAIILALVLFAGLTAWILRNAVRGIVGGEMIRESEDRIIGHVHQSRERLEQEIDWQSKRAVDNIVSQTYTNISDELMWGFKRDQQAEKDRTLDRAIHFAEEALSRTTSSLEQGVDSTHPDYPETLERSYKIKGNLATLLTTRRHPEDREKALAMANELYDSATQNFGEEYDEQWANWLETSAWVFIGYGDETEKQRGVDTIGRLCDEDNIPCDVRRKWRDKYLHDYTLKVETPGCD